MKLRKKFQGALLGTGIGDSIGRAREGGAPVPTEKIKKSAEKKEVLRYTDDTQQMIALAESLIEGRGFDGEIFAEKLVEKYNPSRGYGPGSSQVIRALDRGEQWDEPAQSLFGGEGSFGNGSSMRAAPVGLFWHDDLENLSRMAEEASRITHAHKLGIEGSTLQAAAVALATRKHPEKDLEPEEFLREIRDFSKDKKYRGKLDKIEEFLNSDVDKTEVIHSLGTGVEAFHSVPTAIYCFLSHHESFEDSVSFAVSLGGDADTIGAMTGAISGAHRGKESIPRNWRNKLEDRKKIAKLADDLHKLKN